MMDNHQNRLKRLKFRAWHRGFVEADLILGPFVDAHAAALSVEQLDRLETLLEEGDHDIYAWIIDREPTPARFDTDVMALIKQFRDVAHAAPVETLSSPSPARGEGSLSPSSE
jgi:antitoxin CptB